MLGATVSIEVFWSVLISSGFILLVVGFLLGLVFDIRIRKRNRRSYEVGGKDREAMLDRPEKTGTKCGLPHCRHDKNFVDEMGGRDGKK